MPAAVITVSDRSAAGARDDVSGPVAVRVLREAGFACADARVVADGADSVEAALREAIAAGARLVVTTGGTAPSCFAPSAAISLSPVQSGALILESPTALSARPHGPRKAMCARL